MYIVYNLLITEICLIKAPGMIDNKLKSDIPAIQLFPLKVISSHLSPLTPAIWSNEGYLFSQFDTCRQAFRQDSCSKILISLGKPMARFTRFS